MKVRRPPETLPLPPRRAGSSAPEEIVLKAIQANPVSAPYRIKTSWQKGLVVISGRVGSTAVHGVVVQTAIDLGYPFKDDLIVDTSEAMRVASLKARSAQGSQSAQRSGQAGDPGRSINPPLFPISEDVPTFGSEIPAIAFPPGWKRADSDKQKATSLSDDSGAKVGRSSGSPGQTGSSGGPRTQQWIGPTPRMGRVRVTVDETGRVSLTGVVASEEARQMIEKQARATPGVNAVFSELTVELPRPVPQPEPVQGAPLPPDPPSPVTSSTTPPSPAGSQPARPGPVREDAELMGRIYEVLAAHPVLRSLTITVNSSRGVVTLKGKVPSASEAMLAYRTTEQTPGVDSIVDELEFPPPDDEHPNPLRQGDLSEDLDHFLPRGSDAVSTSWPTLIASWLQAT